MQKKLTHFCPGDIQLFLHKLFSSSTALSGKASNSCPMIPNCCEEFLFYSLCLPARNMFLALKFQNFFLRIVTVPLWWPRLVVAVSEQVPITFSWHPYSIVRSLMAFAWLCPSKKMKSVDFFHTSQTPPPAPKCGKFPKILRSKRVKFQIVKESSKLQRF